MQIVFFVDSGRRFTPQVWLRPNSAALDIIHASMASVLVCTNFQVTGCRLQYHRGCASLYPRLSIKKPAHKARVSVGNERCEASQKRRYCVGDR